MFHEAKPRETSRYEGNKINCFTRDQSISVLFYSLQAKTLQFHLNFSKFARLLITPPFEHALITCTRGQYCNIAPIACHVTTFACMREGKSSYKTTTFAYICKYGYCHNFERIFFSGIFPFSSESE